MFPKSSLVVDLAQGKDSLLFWKPLKSTAKELPAQMLRALQDGHSPPPGLDPPDNGPGPRLQPVLED
eukprot:2525747-Alexandrium_andersonii.AAC.1